MSEKLLAGICLKFEWKKVGLWILLSFFLVTISLCSILKPYIDPLPIPFVLQIGIDNLQQKFAVYGHGKFEPFLAPMCNFSGKKSDFCELDGDIRIQGNTSSIYFNSPQLANTTLENNTFGIKLYARKTDNYVMGKAKELWLKPMSRVQEMPQCTINYSVPAIIFSSGGYAGNIFHDYTDVLIPLYLTSLPFNGEVQLLSQDRHSWWIKRHEVMFKALSKYEIIDFNRDKEIRCFKNATVGVYSHRDFGIEFTKLPYGLTLRNFTQFIRRIYSLERETAAIKMTIEDKRKPRLLIISRKKTRTILNEDELVALSVSLGYDVDIIDARMSLKNLSKIVNSMDVMIGVHGAGLTNMVYLPENAVLIQVVPIGLHWLSKTFFEYPARNMSLQYLSYKVSESESSLIQQYSIQHEVLTDPNVAKKEGWFNFKKTYLDNQDVRLDMSKFKVVLLKAFQLLRR